MNGEKFNGTLTDWQYFSPKYATLTLYIFGVAGLIGLFVDWQKGLTLLSIAALALLATPFRFLSIAGGLGMVVTWSSLAFATTGRVLALLPVGLALAILIPMFYFGTRHKLYTRPGLPAWIPRKYSLRELILDLSYGLVVYGVFRVLNYAWSNALL